MNILVSRILLLLVFGYITGCTESKIIELPITEKDGYGPFEPSWGGVSVYSEKENNPWKKSNLKLSGIPDNWTNLQIGDIETNIRQTVYQNHLMGNISDQFYSSVQESWSWIPDTMTLSKEPLKTKIGFVLGTDPTGAVKMVVDANNNLDFNDDVVFTPFEIIPDNPRDKDSFSINDAITVSFERLRHNKIVKLKAPLYLEYWSSYNSLMYNFPQHALAKLNGEDIAIMSDDFRNVSYHTTALVPMNDSLKMGKKAKFENTISQNEYMEVNGKTYKNLGVNRNRDVLVLEKVDLPRNQLHSTQVGFKALPFEGLDFITKSSVSSESLQGKYLLLDFWAVWCGPCFEEFPNLKVLYDKVDKSKFEIIGIIGDSPSDALEKIINEQSLVWPQIFSDSTNPIKETYSINKYPSTFLLDPAGIIVAKDLRGKELENKVLELVAK